MQYFQPCLTSALLFLTMQISLAQISPGSRIWSGGMSVTTGVDELNVSVAPTIHHFLSRAFSLGGALSLQGGLSGGVQRVVVAPEARVYFNPLDENLRWFGLAGTQLSLFNKQDREAEDIFHIRLGLGANARLADGVMWEGSLYVLFEEKGNTSIFTYPGLKLENRLVYFLDLGRRTSDKEVLPLIGRGSWMIGGTGPELTWTRMPSIRHFAVGIAPAAGYFFNHHLAAGLQLSLAYTSQSTDFVLQEQNFGVQTISWGFRPFVRYLWGGLQERIRPFAEVNQDMLYSESDLKPFNVLPADQRSFRLLAANLKGGVDIFLSNKVALEAGLAVRKDLKTGRTDGGLELGFQFFVR